MAFAVKYLAEFNDRHDSAWKAEILEDGFAGSVTDLRLWGSNPLKIKFRASNVKLKHSPICPKDVELSVTSDNDYFLMEFAYNTSKHYLMKVFQDGSLRFQGFILKGLNGERYISPPYQIQLRATDGLAQLKNVQYTHIGGDNVVKGSEVLVHILTDLLGITQDFILDNSNLFPVSLSPGANDTSLDLTFVNQQLFVQEEMNAFEVLSDLMTTHHCRFYQSNEFWVVEQLEGLSTGLNQLSKKRDSVTYAFDSNFTNVKTLNIHEVFELNPANVVNNPIGSASISFIEAPKEIQVDTKLVEFDNILENDGLDNWGNRVNWLDIAGGNMTEGSNAQGYAADNKFNTQTINGFPVLGIGRGITNSLYILSLSGKTHNITGIVDIGGNILEITFNNEFGSAPNWPIANNKLFIENRGVFEVTTAASGSGGSSLIRIRVNDPGSTPKNGDRIIGNINLCFALEQTLEIPATQIAKVFKKGATVILTLEIEYASQYYGASTGYGFISDEGVHFIGIKAGKSGGAQNTMDTFNDKVWNNLAVNLFSTDFTQIVGIPETEHEQFNTFKLDIPLDWQFAEDAFIHVALIGSYSKAVVYKSIKFTMSELEERTHTESNVIDNNTSIVLTGTLFKAQQESDNTEYGAMGGVLDVNGDEHILFDGAKAKNEVIAELIKDGYDDTLQVWKGLLNGYIGENRILIDPKNFDRTFQIQEVTNNLNDNTSQMMIVEIRSDGFILSVLTITGPSSVKLAAHSVSGSSNANISVSNTGNIGFNVKIITSLTHFINNDNKHIISGDSEDYNIKSPSDTEGLKSENLQFQEEHGNSNIATVPTTVVIYSDLATFFADVTSFTQVVPERYEYSAQQSTNVAIILESVIVTSINVSATASVFAAIVTPQTIAGFGTKTFNIFSTRTQLINDQTDFVNFQDTTTPFLFNSINAQVTIKGEAILKTVTGGHPITVNRVRFNGGGFINLPGAGSGSGQLDFNQDDLIEWEVQTGFDATPGTLTMLVNNRNAGNFITFSSGSSFFSNIISIDTSAFPAGWNRVSIDFSIT